MKILVLFLLATSTFGFAKLPASKNACTESELSFDYWPHGGIRNFWCHARSVMSWDELARSAPDIWLKGPHGQTRLALHDKHDFGHYNPVFVHWLVDQIPASSPENQAAYDFSARELARAYYRVHAAMTPSIIKKEREKYLHVMDEKNPDWASFYERWSTFLGDAEHDWGGVDPNLQSASVAWWLRRDIDGTAPIFFEGLTKLMKTYDADWLAKH